MEYYCDSCKKESPDYTVEDVGVGVTEAWGQRDVDIVYVAFTTCCGAATVTRNGDLVNDYEED